MPTPNTPNTLGRSSTLDNILSASELLLTLVKDVSSVATVPFMRDAAELSLSFLNTVQAVRENKEAWLRMAESVAQLVLVVAKKVTDSPALDSEPMSQVKELYRMLLKVREIVEIMTSRKLFKRIVGFKDDAAKLQQLREDLKVAIDVFMVRAAITNAENMQKVTTSQDTLLTGQQSLNAKQDKVLLTQKMTNQYLQKIDTSINALKTNTSAPSPYSANAATPAHTMSSFPFCAEPPAHYATPSNSGFAHLRPARANVTIIAGDHVMNNISKVTNISKSHQVTTINTIGSYNTYKAPVSPSATRGNRGRRQRPSITSKEVFA